MGERDDNYTPRYTVKSKGFYLFGKSILTMQVSNNSPWRSVQDARSQRWSWDKQYPTKSTLYFWLASPNVSPSSVCLSLMGANMKGGEYSWIGLGLCNKVNTIISRYIRNYLMQETHKHRLAVSTEQCKFETINKFKAFIVHRDTGKRVVIDNSFLLVKTDALQTLSKDFFLYPGKLRYENSLWTGRYQPLKQSGA